MSQWLFTFGQGLFTFGQGLFCMRKLAVFVCCSAVLVILAVQMMLASQNDSLVALGAILRTLWAPFCHQEAAKTFTMLGQPFCACYRCTALFLGGFFGALASLVGGPHDRNSLRGICILGFCLLGIDVFFQAVSLYASQTVRCSTGLCAGALVTYASLRFIPERGIRNG